MIEQLKEEIEADEGRVTAIYNDHLGYKTAGVGHLLRDGIDPEYEWPIGAPVSQERVNEWFDEDIKNVINETRWHFDDWDGLPEEVQLICCNMMFNLGGPRFSGFKKFIAAVDRHDWPDAALEMKDSKWHRQVQNRSSRLIERMLAIG